MKICVIIIFFLYAIQSEASVIDDIYRKAADKINRVWHVIKDDVEQNFMLSENFIKQINDARTTWKAGSNFHPETSEAAIRGLMGVHPSHLLHMPPQKDSVGALIDEWSIPRSFDPRHHWPHCPSISEIRDQGSCGSCWAFGAASAMSDRLCIHSNQPHERVSSEDLLTCCHSCGFGCNGGFPGAAWNYWTKSGIVTGGAFNTSSDSTGSGMELCQSYKVPPCEHHVAGGKRKQCSEIGVTPSCTQKCDDEHLSYDDSKTFAKGSYSIKPSVVEIQRELMINGPVEAAFTVFQDFVNYKSGVYQHVMGKALGGHAVKILGWGTENDVPYWMVANSWNYDWGENGTFKILRGRNHCGIEEAIVAGIPK